MISPQARIIKQIIRLGNRKLPAATLEQQRREFERNMRILFPTVSSRFVKNTTIAGVPVEEVYGHYAKYRTIVYVHGGAFALGSSRTYRQHLVRLARLCRARILSIDYSLAPEHPYPHASNQTYAVWQTLTRQPDLDTSRVVLMGDSAGASIILTTMLRLRDESLPLPACLVLVSAGLDATFTGESFSKNEQTDIVLSPEMLDFYMRAYVQGNDRNDPAISTVFADLHDFPPMLIHIGSDELQLSSSVMLYDNAKAVGVDATLFIGKDMWHNWHLFAGVVPEARQAMRAMCRYIVEHTDTSRPA